MKLASMDPRWRRLGELVTAERVRLGHRSLAEFARSSGISKTTVDSIEHARKEHYDPATLAAIEHALDWEPGSIDRVLRGLSPVRVTDPDLAAVQEMWPRLSPDARRMVRVLVAEAVRMGR